eukprot:jgi/Tetstr1/437800/TSEL_026441.t1
MDNTRLPDDLYDSEGCGGGNAAKTYSRDAPADGLEGDDESLGFPAKSPGHAAFIDSRDSIDYLPQAYAESMPPVGLTNPGLWNPRNDEWDRYLADEKKHATRDEYRHYLPCYVIFTPPRTRRLRMLWQRFARKNATARDTADAN